MRSTVLYVTTVLIWGSTWLAIEYQLGVVAPEVSLVYRFSIAALLMWIYCLIKQLPMQFSIKNHFFFMTLACCNFGFNYLILYWAQNYLTSAMTSIAFSTLLIMNIINTRIFFGRPIAPRILIGATLGLVGIIALFWQDIKTLDFASEAIIGLAATPPVAPVIETMFERKQTKEERKAAAKAAREAKKAAKGAKKVLQPACHTPQGLPELHQNE